MRFTWLMTIVCFVAPCAALAQTAPTVTWRAAAGWDEFSYRESGDAPVVWIGAGPMLGAEMTRAHEQREHRFGAAFSAPGNFAYETGLGVVPRPSGESATFVQGEYAYRRYFAHSILRVLHAGFGVSGAGEHRSLHHQPGGSDLTESDTIAAVAGVLALRVRSGRVGTDLEWGNALMLGHGHQRLVSNATYDVASWGGGTAMDLGVRAGIAMTSRTALFITYSGRHEDTQIHLQSYTDGHRRVTAGVAYVR
jgi:hypothetical protein